MEAQERCAGNALRCMAKMFGERTGFEARDSLSFESPSGLHEAHLTREGTRVVWSEVDLGAPSFLPETVPVDVGLAEQASPDGEGPVRLVLEALGEPWEGLALSMGNPHFVLPLRDAPDSFPVERLGAALEIHTAFPDRVNVGFAFLSPEGALHARTWERGSGETLACGSSACAMVVAFVSLGALRMDSTVPVTMPGGTLTGRWSRRGVVFLGGPARDVYRGRLELPND